MFTSPPAAPSEMEAGGPGIFGSTSVHNDIVNGDQLPDYLLQLGQFMLLFVSVNCQHRN